MKKIIKSICIRPEIWELLEKISNDNGRSCSNMIEQLIIEFEKGKE